MLALIVAQIVLAAPPSATIDVSDLNPEIGQSVDFSATVTDDDPGDTHSFEWDFGDGATANTAEPSHSYDTPGDKTVTVTVRDAAGEVGTATASLHVNAPPTASFTFTPANPAIGQNIVFTSTASDPEGGPVSRAWDLDNDGAFDDGSDPVEQWSFDSGGNKTVRLRATDGNGAPTVVTHSVPVRTNTPPIASFTIEGTNPVTPAVPDVNEAVRFVSTSTDPDGDTIREQDIDWDLDNDGAFDDGSGTVIERAYPTAGQKTVGLRVADPSGATTPTTQQFRVNAPPTVALNISNAEAEPGQRRTVPLAGQEFTFTSGPVAATPGVAPAPGCAALSGSAAMPGSSDPEGLALVEWDLDNDGLYGVADAEATGASTQSPPTGYAAGARTVGVRVTDSDGAQRTATLAFRVNAAPAPSFLIEPLTPVINETTIFSSTSFDPDPEDSASALTYSWDLDNDGVYCELGETGLTANRVFPTASMNPGHPVTLRVTDTGGITRTLTRPVVVQNTIPSGSISFAPVAPLPGQAVTLTGSATSPTGKAIAAMEWDLNFDPSQPFGTDAAGASVTHAFGSPGPKSIALRVTEDGGGFSIVRATVVVNAPPTAGLRIGPDNPFVGDPVTLSSTSVDPDGPLAGQQWDLDGDGAYDDASGPVVSTSFPRAGQRRIGLRVTDGRGAVATASGVVNVRTRPLTRLSGIVIGIGGSVSGGFTDVKRLRVKAPKGATITVKCKGKGCPKKAAKRGTGKVIRFKTLERRLAAGVKVIITVTRGGFIGQQTTYTMRRTRLPKRVDRCIKPGAKRAISCPS